MDFGIAELQQLVEFVWTEMLGLPVSPTGSADFPAEHLTSFVTIKGGWQGTVAIDCDPQLARQIASQLFGEPSAQIDAVQINDALGEMANIVGGNIKPLMPGPCQLSLPTICEPGAPLRDANSEVVLQAVFLSCDHHFRVTVLKSM